MELKIDHKSPVPLHVQVEELMRKLIEMPEYQQGGFLPREVELAKKLGISRNTLRQATNKLEYEGLLVEKRCRNESGRKNGVDTIKPVAQFYPGNERSGSNF